MSHDAKSLQRIYSIEKKLEKNDFTLGDHFHGGGDYNKSQECFSKVGCVLPMVLKQSALGIHGPPEFRTEIFKLFLTLIRSDIFELFLVLIRS